VGEKRTFVSPAVPFNIVYLPGGILNPGAINLRAYYMLNVAVTAKTKKQNTCSYRYVAVCQEHFDEEDDEVLVTG